MPSPIVVNQIGRPTIRVVVNQGIAGTDGPNSVTSATTSDGTADLDLLNVQAVNATVTDTLTAPHIHGNIAGSVYAHIRAGENLTKGDPVYVSGSHGSGSTLIPIVSRADASNAAKMPAIGIMDEAVANNANGHMVIVGTITELDTAGLTVNAELYVAAGGGMTGTPPTARAQPVARVERANANNGAVIVKVNGLSASDATPNTLVRRDANGGASLEYPTFGSGFQITETGGSDTFGMRSATGDTWSMYGPDYGDFMSFSKAGVINFSPSGYTYGTGSASAHRTALGLGTGDSVTFAGVRATGNGSVSAPVIRFGTIGDHGFYTTGGSTVNLSIGLVQRYIFGTTAGNFGFRIMSDTGIRIGETNDVSLSRLAAGQWGMGSGALGTFDASLKLTGIENLGTLSVTGASTLSGGATFGGTTEQAATRTALGGGATGQAIFQAATTSAAQTAAGFVTLSPAAYADLVATGTTDPDTIYIVQE
jgi:hypothetical protein